MSYSRDLDDCPDAELRAEMDRREKLRGIGRCDYCTRPSSTPPCRYPERHAASAAPSRQSDTRSLQEKLFNVYGALFPNYAWCDAEDAVDLLNAEVLACRKERDDALASRQSDADASFDVWADADDLADTREGQYATVHGTRPADEPPNVVYRRYRIVPAGPERPEPPSTENT